MTRPPLRRDRKPRCTRQLPRRQVRLQTHRRSQFWSPIIGDVVAWFTNEFAFERRLTFGNMRGLAAVGDLEVLADRRLFRQRREVVGDNALRRLLEHEPCVEVNVQDLAAVLRAPSRVADELRVVVFERLLAELLALAFALSLRFTFAFALLCAFAF